MKIRTKSFILRKPKKEDADDLWDNYNDKDVARNMVHMETEREFKEGFRKGLKKKDRTSERFVIEIDGMAVGKITLRDIIPEFKGRISSWLGKKYRNKGIMTRAKKLVVDYWTKKYKLRRIEAYVRTFNKASARSLEKVGFKREGILRKNVLKNGRYYDDYIYAYVK